MAGHGVGDQPAQHVGGIDDIGVRQKKIFGRIVKGLGSRNALVERP